MSESSADFGRVDPAWLAGHLEGGNARDIAAAIAALIRTDRLPRGRRLPTVRAVASAAGVSVGTIANAWSILRNMGLVSTHRRGGSMIADEDVASAAQSLPAQLGWVSVDLAQGLPDLSLQPGLDAALAAGVRTANLNSPYPEAITAPLLAAVRHDWPFEPEAWLTAGGGTEGSLLAIEATAEPGDVVAIEEPTSPRLLEVLEMLGVRTVGVSCDAQGPDPESLRRVLLQHDPASFIFQPRAQVPLGHGVTGERMAELAEVFKRTGARTNIVEDDNTGPIAEAQTLSLGRFLPDRVLHVRTYCKTYGVDLRTCVAAGGRRLIERMAQKRSHGVGMTSRILQNALAYLIQSSQARLVVDHARARYAWRRSTLAAALGRHGLVAENADGLILWVAVPDEKAAMVTLATYGVTVGAGQKCFIVPPATDHLRIAVSRLPDDEHAIEQLAGLIAAAVHGKARQEFD